MNKLKLYLKEFFYALSAGCVLFSFMSLIILIILAPFGLCIYLGDTLGYHDIISFSSAIMCYATYWIIIRHFNLIDIKGLQ